jgi:cytochrome b
MVTGKHVRDDSLKVWDVPLRLFHWLLVAAITVAFLSSEGDSPIAAWHIAAGWAAAVLIVFRLVWGFIGGEHARFVNFVRPSRIAGHIRSLLSRDPEHSVGHNPLGALAVLALLAGVAAVLWTGIQLDAGRGSEDLHEALAYGLLVLIGIHVAAVIAMSILARENLVQAMITGRKRASLHAGARNARAPGPMALLVGGAVIAATVVAILRFDAAAFGPRLETERGERHGGDHPSSETAEGTDKD